MMRFAFFLILLMQSLIVWGQGCSPPSVSSFGDCPGTHSVTAYSTYAGLGYTSMNWYDHSGTLLGGGSFTQTGTFSWQSTYTGTFSATNYYYVEAVCSNGTKSTWSAFQFTALSALTITASNPSDPLAVPDGGSVILTASNGSGATSGFYWSYGSLLNPTIGTNNSITVNQGGKYIVTGQACGASNQSQDVNHVPVSDAGQDRTVGLPLSSYTVNGSGHDQDDGDALTYAWSQFAGPVVTLSNINSPALLLTNLVAGKVGLQLQVSDRYNNVAYSAVYITFTSSTNNLNYVEEDAVLVPQKNVSDVPGLPFGNKLSTFNYMDDLSRDLEQVQLKASPAGNDVIGFKEYDALGREATKYLPYTTSSATNNGSFVSTTTAESAVATFYNDTAPHSATGFEASPLSRPTTTSGPGVNWQPAGKSMAYATNSGSDVLQWTINSTSGLPQANSPYYYSSSTLYKKTLTDETGVMTETYTDFRGLHVLSRSDVGGKKAETYYVYDSKNNLSFILTPELIKVLKNQATPTFTPSKTQIDRWAYQLKYDFLNRVVESKQPGSADLVYTIYDGRGRVVLTQDGNLRNGNTYQSIPGNRWYYTKYDENDRPVVSGIYGPDNTNTTRSAMQLFINSLNNGQGYQSVSSNVSIGTKTGVDIAVYAWENINDYRASNSITFKSGFNFKAGVTGTSLHGSIYSKNTSGGRVADVFPSGNDEPLKKNYYDNYYDCEICADANTTGANFSFVQEGFTSISSPAYNEPFPTSKNNLVKGKAVGSSVKVLNSNIWLNTIVYYNRYGRVAQFIGDNHVGGRDRISYLYDFAGRMLEEVHSTVGYPNNSNGGVNTLRQWFSYDAVGRLSFAKHQINSQPPVTLSAFEYSEIGQISRKKLHATDGSNFIAGTNFIESIDYSYNVRNSLSKISNEYFGMDLAYESSLPGNAGNPIRKDGLLSAISWKQDKGTKRRLYNFTYDNLDRVTSSNYKMTQDGTIASPDWSSQTDFYSETGINYDLNGNILQLNRNTEYFSNGTRSSSSIDQLTYSYGEPNYGVPYSTQSDNGNQLLYVTEGNPGSPTSSSGFVDGGTNSNSDPDYLYDTNGNLIKDQNLKSQNKKIDSIFYYYNNLPRKVKFSDKSFLQYKYDAAGVKLNQSVYLIGLYFNTDYTPVTSIGTISLSLASGRLKLGGASVNDKASIALTTIPGHQYRLTFDVDLNSAGKITVGATDGTNNLLQMDVSANGSFSYPFTATTNQSTLTFTNTATGVRDFFLDNIFVQDLSLASDYVGEIVYLNSQVLTIKHPQGRITAPTYANLMNNPDAGSIDGYSANGAVSITIPNPLPANGQTYVVATCNTSTGTPGVFPINTVKGGSYPIKAGETYLFQVLGYQSNLSTTATLYAKSDLGDVWWGEALKLSGAEDWSKLTISVPNNSTATSIQLGVLWTTPVGNNTIYINRVSLYKLDFEYNYFITDQVGSTRVVLQTTPGKQVYMATMELQNQSSDCSTNPGGENCKFLNMSGTYANQLQPLPDQVNYPGYGFQMNSTFPVGPAKSIKVYPGDKIDASVFSYFKVYSNNNPTLAGIATSVVSSFFPTPSSVGEVGAITQGINNAYAGGVLSGHSGSTSYPSAYLNYLVFDVDYNLIPAKSGAVPIDHTANVKTQLSIPTISADELGYVYLYLSYENASTPNGNDVYFDDFKITVQESNIIQVNNFYPFGMQSYTWLRNGETDNAYLYQGKELIAQTGWHDFGSRMYYADLGRWFATDPQSQFSSPYMAMGNMPMMGRDPDGEIFLLDDLIVFGVGFLVGDLSYSMTKGKGLQDFFSNDAIHAGLMGGLTAEAGYLGMGGGGLLGGFGKEGVVALNNAAQYSMLYATNAGINVAEKQDEIGAMSGNQAFWAIAGFEGVAAIQSGFQTDFAEDEIDKIYETKLGSKITGGVNQFLRGTTADAIGGGLGGGLKSMVMESGWNGGEFWSQAVGGFSSKLSGNLVDWLAHDIYGEGANLAKKANKAIHKKHYTTVADYVKYRGSVADWSLLLFKEAFSVGSGQSMTNLTRRIVGGDYKEKYFRDSNYSNLGSGAIKDAWKLLGW